MSSIHGCKPTYAIATWQEAEEVRRIVRERGWAAAARRLGWPESNARQNIAGALRRAPAPPPPSPDEEARARAVREAEEDPVLSRRCAKCGRKGYRINRGFSGTKRNGGKTVQFAPAPVPMTLLGGRWLCDDCVPHRRRPSREICARYADEHRAVFR